MNIILIIVLILLLFLGENPYNLSGYGATYHQYVIALNLVALSFVLGNYGRFMSRKEFKLMTLIIPINVIFCLVFIGFEGIIWKVFQLYGALIFCAAYMLLYEKRHKFCRYVFWIMLVFYVVEVGIAIYERLMQELVFGWVTSEDAILSFGQEETEFRSTSLLGHPLQNALTVSVIMMFILSSPLKNIYKYSLWAMGYFSIFCFNTRSSMVANILFLFAYILTDNSRKKQKKTGNIMQILVFFLIIVGTAYYAITQTTYGGRLSEMGLYDESSAKTRIDVFNIFKSFSIVDFLFPLDNATTAAFIKGAKLVAIENFWINWMFNYGIIALIVNTVIIWKFIKARYVGYTKRVKWFTIGAFLLIASTNNSLSASYIPTTIFLICVLIYNPLYISFIPSRLRN